MIVDIVNGPHNVDAKALAISDVADIPQDPVMRPPPLPPTILTTLLTSI